MGIHRHRTQDNILGYIDQSGNFTPEHKFFYLDNYAEDLSVVGVGDDLNGSYGFIDRRGKIVIPLKYLPAIRFLRDPGAETPSDYNKYGYISR